MIVMYVDQDVNMQYLSVSFKTSGKHNLAQSDYLEQKAADTEQHKTVNKLNLYDNQHCLGAGSCKPRHSFFKYFYVRQSQIIFSDRFVLIFCQFNETLTIYFKTQKGDNGQ